MNEYFEEQEILGKAYDSKLMIRLLKYAKPHLKGIIVAIILIFLITIGKLLNPYIIKNAIDKSIDPFVIMKIQGKEERVYLIDNEKFIRKYPIRFYNGKFYILERDFKKIPKEDISILRAKDYKILRNSVLLYFLISFLIFILSYVQVYILHLTSQRIIYDMRKLFSPIY
jgi:ABC-type multidrug transport system fused ATPase/permease subunit